MENIFEKYQLNQVINASGKMTALGVSKYVNEAIEAQAFGGENFFEMDQLAKNVGHYLAELIGSEDAEVVSSASAGIALSVAALIGKGSQLHLYNPYDARFSKREVILPKGHNVDYGAPIQTMIELGGGKVVEAGYANKCTPELIEDRMTEQTVAILFVKSHHTVQKSMVSIEETVEIAQKHKLPLIVDAAAEQDLTKYLKAGADLVIYSGAKALEGPSSGIVLGHKEYIEWIRLQTNGIGRAMKIGKENILGLAAAIEHYLEVGPETGIHMKERLYPFLEQLNQIPTIEAKMVRDLAGREIYRAQVSFSGESTLNAREVMKQLKLGSPAIYVREHQVNNNLLEFDIRSVNEQEMDLIIQKLHVIIL